MCVSVKAADRQSSSGNNPKWLRSLYYALKPNSSYPKCAFILFKNASILNSAFRFGFSFWFNIFESVCPLWLWPCRVAVELPKLCCPFVISLHPLTHHSSCLCLVFSSSLFLLNLLMESHSHGSLREQRVAVAWLLLCVPATDLWYAVNGNVVRKIRELGGEIVLRVWICLSLISCHWTTWKECFEKDNLYIFIYDAIQRMYYTVVLKMTRYCFQFI